MGNDQSINHVKDSPKTIESPVNDTQILDFQLPSTDQSNTRTKEQNDQTRLETIHQMIIEIEINYLVEDFKMPYHHENYLPKLYTQFKDKLPENWLESPYDQKAAEFRKVVYTIPDDNAKIEFAMKDRIDQLEPTEIWNLYQFFRSTPKTKEAIQRLKSIDDFPNSFEWDFKIFNILLLLPARADLKHRFAGIAYTLKKYITSHIDQFI